MGPSPPDYPLGLNLATRSHLLRLEGRIAEAVEVGLAIADPGRGYDAESLFRRADGALYRAKRAGRNRVLADDPLAAGTLVADERQPRQWTMALPD